MNPSPIEPLYPAIASSPFRIAPESASSLNSLIKELGLKMEFVDHDRLFAEVRVESSTIRLGIPFLEALWAAAHAYIVTFHEYQAASREGASYFGIGASARRANAIDLYRQLLQGHATGRPADWPSDGVTPVQFPEHGTDLHVTNELFLVAVAWILHHEISHSKLQHDERSVRPVADENEADRSATEWICHTTSEAGPLLKRSMGMVTAIVFLLAYDLEIGRSTWSTHPPSFERLILNLDHTKLPEDATIYAFAFVLVQIHLALIGRNVEPTEAGSFRDDCVSACLAVRALANGA